MAAHAAATWQEGWAEAPALARRNVILIHGADRFHRSMRLSMVIPAPSIISSCLLLCLLLIQKPCRSLYRRKPISRPSLLMVTFIPFFKQILILDLLLA